MAKKNLIMKALEFVVVLSIIHFTRGNTFHNEYVVKLNSENFNKTVLESNSVWLVKFYAPWCRASILAAPEYSRAAEALDGIIKVGAVDDGNEDLLNLYDIERYPTFKIFGHDKANCTKYEGNRTAVSLAKAAMKAAVEKIKACLDNSSDAESIAV